MIFAGGKRSGPFPAGRTAKADGLPTRECSAGSHPRRAARWMADYGFPPQRSGVGKSRRAQAQPPAPAVIIESVLVEGLEQKTNRLGSGGINPIVGSARLRAFGNHYTGLNFTAPNGVRFKYRLEGHETAWTEAGDTRVALQQSGPGHYFSTSAPAMKTVCRTRPAVVLEITVQPRFWQTGWFLAALIVFFLGLVVAVVRYLFHAKIASPVAGAQQAGGAGKRTFPHRPRPARSARGEPHPGALLGASCAESDQKIPRRNCIARATDFPNRARNDPVPSTKSFWAVNPSNDTLDSLNQLRLQIRTGNTSALAGCVYRVDVPAQLPVIPNSTGSPPQRFLAFKGKPSNNVVKQRRHLKSGFDCDCSPASLR